MDSSMLSNSSSSVTWCRLQEERAGVASEQDIYRLEADVTFDPYERCLSVHAGQYQPELQASE